MALPANALAHIYMGQTNPSARLPLYGTTCQCPRPRLYSVYDPLATP
eukprot:SAG31_NODE_47696_length_227_cov_10.593750_1_plen_46_part_10